MRENNLFISQLFEHPTYFFCVVLVVIFSVTCHEFMHAWVALRCGDDTAARQGHLTFNPFKQMGVLSLLLLAVVGIAWGMVPVNPANFRKRWYDVVVSLAGPATNLLLAVIFWGLLIGALRFEWGGLTVEFFSIGVLLNLVLFLFNLLPVPPLDGFSIVRCCCPGVFRMNSEVLKGAFLLLGLLAFLFVDYLFLAAAWIFTWANHVVLG